MGRRRWIVLLVLLAVVLSALVVALALGIANSWKALREAGEAVPSSAPHPTSSSSGRLERAFRKLPWEGHDVATAIPLEDPTRAWLTRWNLIREARHRIDVAYFILEGDVFGLSFLGALLEAAERGVVVRILVDALATDMADTTHTLTGENFLRALDLHPNIEVRASRPQLERVVAFLQNLEAASLIASEHDKILNVDGQRTLTGGRNIGLDYFTMARHPGRQFLDLDVLLTSSQLAARTQAAFERLYDSAETIESIGIELSRSQTVVRAHEHMRAWLEGRAMEVRRDADLEELERDWQAALAERPEYRGALGERLRERSFSARVRVVDSTAREAPEPGEITEALLRFVSEARSDVTLVSPYLVLNEGLASALEAAAQRGVRLTVLTNSPDSSDNAVSQALFLEQWPTLLSRVPSLRLFVVGGEDTLHTKLLLFDRKLSLVGTYNLDPTAMQMNSELMVAIWSEQLNRHFRRGLERRIGEGAPAVFRYRIRHAKDGGAKLDAHGKPEVEFGPEDHLTEEQLEATRDTQWVVEGVRRALGLEPLLSASPAEGEAVAPAPTRGVAPTAVE